MSRQLVLVRVRASTVVAIIASILVAIMMTGSPVTALSLNSSNNKSSKSSTASSNPSVETSSVVTDRRAFVVRSAGAAAAAAGVGVFGAGSMPSPALAEESSLPMNGGKAPDFELPNSRGTGQVTTLNSLTKTGKWTVLYFYPGAFSSGCTLEARGFQKDLEEYRKLNAQIVGVSVDPVEKNAQFCTEEKLDFFMLSDKGGAVSKKYGSSLTIPGFGSFSNRQTYIIDPRGELKWIFTDVESRIARHSAEVLDKLKELEQVSA